MKKAVVGILNRVPVVLIVIGEALVIYLATAVAKLAFTQLDPLYSVWYRVGFMAVLFPETSAHPANAFAGWNRDSPPTRIDRPFQSLLPPPPDPARRCRKRGLHE